MLRTENEWHPKMLTVNYPFSEIEFGQREMFEKQFKTVTGLKPTKDQMGFVHDRDVVVLYGKQCFVTITTNEYFDGGLMKGEKLKQEHVADIPFAYYFPKRVNNPHLAKGQEWEVAVAEDFLLLYNCNFEKNKKYTIVLDIN